MIMIILTTFYQSPTCYYHRQSRRMMRSFCLFICSFVSLLAA